LIKWKKNWKAKIKYSGNINNLYLGKIKKIGIKAK
jgi:hypothetical protein